MKLTPLAITFGLSTVLLASAPRVAHAQGYPAGWPDEPPPRLHDAPKVALGVAFPVQGSPMTGGAFAGLELSPVFRVSPSSMLGVTFAFARSIDAPKDTSYSMLPVVHRLTDAAIDLRYELRFRRPDVLAPWLALGTGAFVRTADGTGGPLPRVRRLGWDVLRAEGGVDTRTGPLAIGIFAAARWSAATECEGGWIFKGGDDVYYANQSCDEGPYMPVWIGGGLRVVLSDD